MRDAVPPQKSLAPERHFFRQQHDRDAIRAFGIEAQQTHALLRGRRRIALRFEQRQHRCIAERRFERREFALVRDVNRRHQRGVLGGAMIEFGERFVALENPHDADEFGAQSDRTRDAPRQADLRHRRDANRFFARAQLTVESGRLERRLHRRRRLRLLERLTAHRIGAIVDRAMREQFSAGIFERHRPADERAENAREIVERRFARGGPHQRMMDLFGTIDHAVGLGHDGAMQLLCDARERNLERNLDQRQARHVGGFALGLRKRGDVAGDGQADAGDAALGQRRDELTLRGRGFRPTITGRQQEVARRDPRRRIGHVDHVRPEHRAVDAACSGHQPGRRQGL